MVEVDVFFDAPNPVAAAGGCSMKLSLTMVPQVHELFQRFFPPQALPGALCTT